MRLPPAALLACFTALAIPALVVRIPPLLDYPNHLVRMWLLAGGIDQPPLPQFYAIDWSLASTNIGIDLIAALLGPLIGAEPVGHLLITTAIILPVLGAILLNRALFGGLHWWQIGFTFFAWNLTLLTGLLSFQIGLGLALLAASLDPGARKQPAAGTTIALRIGLCAALLIFHAFAAAFYATVIAALAFSTPPARPTAIRLWRATLAGLATLAPPLAAFLLLAPAPPGGHAPPGAYDMLEGYTLANKLETALSALVTYNPILELLVAFAIITFLVPTARRGQVRAHAGLLVTAAGLFVLAIAIPSTLGGTSLIDWRFPIMAVLCALAATRPEPAHPSARAIAASVFIIASLARTVSIEIVWKSRQADVVSVERALAAMPRGASLLPLMNMPEDARLLPTGRRLATNVQTYWHLPTLAVPWRHAFVPTLFTARGKQPLRVLPPWDQIAVAEGLPARSIELSAPITDPKLRHLFGYADAWRTRFDYALLINADVPPDPDQPPLPAAFNLIADEGFARLYRIQHTP